ncbi:MAG: hypothetical protein RLP44_31285 [Aggregatilineales bacterium]
MNFEFMTRGVFDSLIIAVILIGSALAFVRLYQDFTRPLPPLDGNEANNPKQSQNRPQWSKDDTQPVEKQNDNTNNNPNEE